MQSLGNPIARHWGFVPGLYFMEKRTIFWIFGGFGR
jgi:hypothetical protein